MDKKTEKEKSFYKNSSLVTIIRNILKYSALSCDKLYFQVITLNVSLYQKSATNAPTHLYVMSQTDNSSHYNILIIIILCRNVTSDEFL